MESETEKLKFFANYIESKLGIIYSDSNYFQLEHRLNDISSQLGLHSLEELWLKARQGIDEPFKALLLDLATNNETSFFRDSSLFRSLIQVIIPNLISKNPKLEELKIWSSACSSGQEPYSIAMALEEAKTDNPNFPDYKILATDFSDRILTRAKERTYSQLELQRGLSDSLIKKYFDPGILANTKILNNNIQPSNFEFKKLNLLDEWFFESKFHIIFCRNVLIYQKIENKTFIVEKIIHSLENHGYLALGAAESLLGISDQFEQIHFENAVFYRRK